MLLNQLARVNINNSFIVSVGIVLDDLQVLLLGGIIVRFVVDKKTGVQVNQIIWIDSKRDFIDFSFGEQNLQIIRKIIVRVIIKDFKDGQFLFVFDLGRLDNEEIVFYRNLYELKNNLSMFINIKFIFID